MAKSTPFTYLTENEKACFITLYCIWFGFWRVFPKQKHALEHDQGIENSFSVKDVVGLEIRGPKNGISWAEIKNLMLYKYQPLELTMGCAKREANRIYSSRETRL